MQTHRLDIHTVGPAVIGERALHGDSLIAFAACESARRSDPTIRWQDMLLDLPLEKAGGPDDWVWKASQVEFEWQGPRSRQHYIRSHDRQGWSELMARGLIPRIPDSILHAGQGPYKAYLLQHQVAPLKRATFWFVGDAELVLTLLQQELHGIGRNTRLGYGRIQSITVSPAPEAEQEFWRRRALPLSLSALKLPGHHRGVATVRPPYYNRSGWTEAWEFDGRLG